jgi:oligopeptide transport system substrate-binding protein
MKFLARVGCGLWLTLLLFSGCGPRVSPPEMTFINGTEPESLDPHIITGQPEYRLCQALGEGLTSRNGKGEIEPGIAERWEISADGLVYTFHLRPAVWSDGSILTADQFARSWLRAISPALGSNYAELHYPIRNAQAYNEGKLVQADQVGVRALDQKTLQVTLAHPTPFFLDLVSLPTFHPVHFPTLEKWGDDWIKPGKLVSNGAYQLLDWRIDDRISLQKNPHYWRASTVALQRIDVLATSRASTAFNLFYAGMTDLILDKNLVPSFFIDKIIGQPYFHATACLATYFYRFNVTRPPFNDPKVRRALALAIDKESIVQRVTRAGEPVASSLVPPGIPGYVKAQGLDYNPAAAREQLRAAGYPAGQGFPSVSILYNSSEQNEQIATAIQAMWKETLGITVTLRKQEWKVYLSTQSELDYDISRSSWVGDYNDPNTFLDMFVTGRGNNRTGWSDSIYDALIERAASETEPTRRFALLREAETRLINEELPIVPLYHYVGIALYHPERLQGYQPNVIDEHPLREMSMRPAKSLRKP